MRSPNRRRSTRLVAVAATAAAILVGATNPAPASAPPDRNAHNPLRARPDVTRAPQGLSPATLKSAYGFPTSPHGTYARDLQIFVDILGFSPMETLVAATKHGGEIMGHSGELGVVKAGALADLLLVAGDPLGDIAILQDCAALRMIMKDGALHKHEETRR